MAARFAARFQAVQPDVRRVLLAGALSAGCYLLVWLAQSGLFMNGLPGAGDGSQALVQGVVLKGTPPDAGQLPRQLAAYYGGSLALFAIYAWLLTSCRRQTWGRAASWLALALPVAFYLGLLFAQPTLSRDVYTYVAQGYVAAGLHGNPYLQPASAVAGTPLGRDLLSSGWLLWRDVSPYGPLWTLVETLALHLTANVWLAVLLLKAVVVAASLGSAAVVWRILGVVAPGAQLLGTVAYLWNPLIVLEVAGDGHNDALMVLCVLLALLAAVRLRPGGAVLGLVLGALVKYLPLLFLPAVLVFSFHQHLARRQLSLRAVLGVLAAVLVAAMLAGVFWSVASPLQSIPEGGQRGVTASLSGAMIWGLSRFFPRPAAAWLVALLLNGIVGAYVLVRSRGIREGTQLLEVCAASAVLYLVVASPLIWPWYVTLPVALLALSPRGVLAPLLILLPLCFRLVAPLTALYENHFIAWPVSAAATMAAAVAVLVVFVYLYSPSLLEALRALSRREVPNPGRPEMPT